MGLRERLGFLFFELIKRRKVGLYEYCASINFMAFSYVDSSDLLNDLISILFYPSRNRHIIIQQEKQLALSVAPICA